MNRISTTDLAGALIETALKGKNESMTEARLFANLEIRELGKKVREAREAST